MRAQCVCLLLLSAIPMAPCFSPAMSLRSPAWTMQASPDGDGSARAAVTRRALFQGATAFALTSGSVANAQSQIGWGDAENKGVVKWGGGFANPLSDQGNDFTAEVVNPRGTPVIITLSKPKKWKISTNTGIAIQDYQTTESAYVVVAPAEQLDAKALLDKVFDINGRYGAFGKIDDVAVTKTKRETNGPTDYLLVSFRFSSLSPGGREIARTGCLKAALVDGDAFMLVSSATSNRWKYVQEDIKATVDSFAAFPAPKTKIKGSISEAFGNKQALGVDGYDLLKFDSPIWRT